MNAYLGNALAGLAAGAVTGILGSGGGLVLVPLLNILNKEDSRQTFSCSLGIMLPICVVCLVCQSDLAAIPFRETIPYLAGGALGGILAILLSGRISPVWLHRLFGGILLWSGLRCLFF